MVMQEVGENMHTNKVVLLQRIQTCNLFLSAVFATNLVEGGES
jgi:hypothetical protein